MVVLVLWLARMRCGDAVCIYYIMSGSLCGCSCSLACQDAARLQMFMRSRKKELEKYEVKVSSQSSYL